MTRQKSARAKVRAGADRELVSLLRALGAAVFRLNARTLDTALIDSGGPTLAPAWSPRMDGRFWASVVPVKDLLPLFEALRGTARDGASRTVEHRFRVPGRGITWVRTCWVRRAAGSQELLGAMLDITASRENERQWHEMESWLAALGEALPFDFWICDSDGRCVLQNPASLRRMGSRVGETLDSPGWEPAFARALAGQTVREELTVPTAGGETFYVRAVTPVHTEDGIQGALGVDIEVTDLKRAEGRLRLSLEELARAQDTAVRTSQLAAIGEMAAVVAHEVRNPLGSIANAVALLRKGSGHSGVAQGELLKIIREESARIDWLVRNLLELARPMVPEKRPLSLGPLVDEALADILKHEGAEQGIRVRREVDPSLGRVPVDPRLFQLATTNVIRNAVQAMGGAGELAVRLEREEEDGNGPWARLTIADNGPGIAPEHRERLFEPFFTTRSTGHGLGLAIIKRVVVEHRGTVDLSSESGRGTSCVIRLPAPVAE
jgi:signal transduction histidine kinase